MPQPSLPAFLQQLQELYRQREELRETIRTASLTLEQTERVIARAEALVQEMRQEIRGRPPALDG